MTTATLSPGNARTVNDPATQILAESGCSEVRVIRGLWCGLKRFNFTTAVMVGLAGDGYQRRYCYEHRADAHAALMAWDGRGHPAGPWIKCKGAGIDLLNPELR